ncbi:hypothetical protein DXG03_003159 [Asterophora parasitica]|uniref:Velvet domain-containing protein n=1 Tax=Asterophora parasitica TaxID=117018 RepID=A0A9P7GEF7_9AGAR|nr:hypothetical protein DXG03_003159 [Asterophora parasitica]
MPFTTTSSLSNWANFEAASIIDVHQPPKCAIGQIFHFMSGQFAGEDIRVELLELQKAEVGRKYARVDRRPLDPPPVVLLRLFRVHDINTHQQREEEIVDYGDVQNLGIICTVDLFPVPEYISSDSILQPIQPNETHDLQPYMEQFTFFPMYPFSTQIPPGATSSFLPIPPRQSMLCRVPPEALPDVVCRMGNHFVTESSKLTRALVGEKFVEPVLVEYQGKKVLVFVFSDLAVQREGSFVLRYRVFDIFSCVLPGMSYCPVQTELYGGLILLLDEGHAILVDVTLCVDHWSGGWVRDYLGTIRVIGHLEASAEELPIPTLPTYAPAPALDPKLVVRAVLVDRAADLDMDLWNKAIEERQRAQ